MIFNQTQTDKCTLSNYKSDSSSVTVSLSQDGIPIPNIRVNIPFTNISWDSIDNVGGALMISSISAVDNERFSREKIKKGREKSLPSFVIVLKRLI